MNILFVCNTNYQLIVALQMRLTKFVKDNVYVLLTSQLGNAKELVNRLKNTHVFTDVYFQKVKNPNKAKPNLFERLKYIKAGVFGSRRYLLDSNIMIDKIIAFNYDLHTHFVYATAQRRNRNLICEKMEEGILSYNEQHTTNGVMRAFYKIRKLLGKPNIKDNLKIFHCFCPEMYQGSLTVQSIPKINNKNKRMKQILFDVFYENNEHEQYSQKYIYLPCIYDIEGGEPIGELQLANKIVNVVGNENLLVKVHPRDDANRYINAGFNVVGASKVPWEVVLIQNNFEDKVLCTSLSGTLLTSSIFLESPPKGYYLFNMCDLSKNALARYYKDVIVEKINMGNSHFYKNISICDSLINLKKED